jgi:hypothetical protein
MAHFCAASPLLVEPNQATLLLSAVDRPELKPMPLLDIKSKFADSPEVPFWEVAVPSTIFSA